MISPVHLIDFPVEMSVEPGDWRSSLRFQLGKPCYGYPVTLQLGAGLGSALKPLNAWAESWASSFYQVLNDP